MHGQFHLGDRVEVAGDPHMPGQKTGVIALVKGNAYGIRFDGMPKVHKWYIAEELKPAKRLKDHIKR